MWWKLVIFAAMSGMIIAAFTTPAPQQQIGESSRIFYFHIPQAWVCVLAFAVSMLYSIRYLRTRRLEDDDRALEAARLGFIFCILATVTGSIFAKVTWGSFWNWDPRETSIFILLLIYGAYFALRGALEIEERRAALAAVYSIFAFLTVPFLVFVVPRMVPSLHPTDSIVNENMKFTMGPAVRMIFFGSLGLFTAVFFWLFSLGRRVAHLRRRQLEYED
ncbi:MAG TPA: cytochrome c biogenesis protein [candidate division Zixibacteria bacterium]|nr:cytochrome c biogenesis protein CcsA [candidate division Zixibacteria bacterium]MDD4917853.1 cytochrome c biogenesis protein [candidate division Zixibacteria bacterium]MDM7973535.1 cytochrome c biogenesis protein [candidate division Zixibacteria bacterium]HOD67401.1 cytochrome c biogenesis protein [candidate division Zixibacteria bacterium]HPM38091.1 cytochrome c biogenesis protein [candidate division Zixibacteria bacterium]